MSLYDVAYVTWPVLLALLVAVPSVLLFANRRAWKDGYAQCDRDYSERNDDELPVIQPSGIFHADWENCTVCNPQPGDSIMTEVTEKLMQHYVSRVDPPGSQY